MLQEYHRQTRIKPFAPILKDQNSKRWDSDISIATNLSLLSISSSSKSSDDENEVNVNEYLSDRDSYSSRESISSLLNESEEQKTKHVDLDPYIFNKHLNRIPSTISNLVETDIDNSANALFDDEKSANQWQNDDYDPRSIRPPPFAQYIKQFKDSRTKIQPIQRRSTRIPVRTTKSEQLRLARQQSTTENISNLPNRSSFTKVPQHRLSYNSPTRQSTILSMNRIASSRTSSTSSFRRSESAKACKVALNTNGPLLLSSMLVKQMQQDIQIPTYSKPLNSTLLHEQPHPPLNHQYKLQRIHHWLEKVVPTDCIEYNDHASDESTVGTNFNDILVDEYDLLSDEKLPNNIERNYAEAHRVLPLFKSEIQRKMQHRDLLLTRLELDLYVI